LKSTPTLRSDSPKFPFDNVGSIGKRDEANPGGSSPRKEYVQTGHCAVHVNLDEAPEIASDSRSREMVAIDDALNELAQIDPRKANVIELRFFRGLNVEETAEVLKISPKA
jgi:DNA-directed RNA polymerase specialized sigma24 family protein